MYNNSSNTCLDSSFEKKEFCILDEEESIETLYSNCPLYTYLISKPKNSTRYIDKCKTLKTSKKLQALISNSETEGKNLLIELISPYCSTLMKDQYGNYMISCLLSNCTQHHRLLILQSIQHDLILIACNSIGTHSLQNLVSLCSTEAEEQIYIQQFSTYVVKLTTHKNASYVIQMLITTLKNKRLLISELVGHATELSRNRLGICIIKRCVSNPQIRDEILDEAVELIQDPYGNYAVQYVLEIWGMKSFHKFTSHLKGNVAQLCLQKYSSNVLAKNMGEKFILHQLYPEVLQEDKMKMILSSSFGCYVVGAMAFHFEPALKLRLLNMINFLLPLMHIRKLEPRWQEIIRTLQ